jgi:tetratricopeptide (TPR) repeat protein
VLNTALKFKPTDANACYYIGNILYEKQPEVAIKSWEKAVELNPRFAIAFRNLGWGYNYHFEDIPAAISYYEKAIALNKNEGIYFSEISRLYERNNTPIATRLKLFEEADIAVVKQRDDASMPYLEYLILSGRADKAVELSSDMYLGYREGESRSRNVRINANLMLGKKFFDNKDYPNALKYFSNALIAREEAGNDVLGSREAQVNYFIGLANEALRNSSAAKTAFKNSVQETSRTVNVMSYYQGLSQNKLGNKDQAKKIFESLISEADRQLQRSEASEVGIIFGRGEAGNDRLSRLHTMRGLGYKGLGDLQKAKADLDKAIELSQSNLWATAEKL